MIWLMRCALFLFNEVYSMSTEIDTKGTVIQKERTDPNLGGPTSTHLDKQEILTNLAWALSFEELNGGSL